jgi:hypothetical protein
MNSTRITDEKYILIILFLVFAHSLTIAQSASSNAIEWGQTVLINNVPVYTDAGKDARGIHPGIFGSQYGRMLKLSNGEWLAVYAIYRNNGYTLDPRGGNELQLSRSSDNGRTWSKVAVITDPGRDLDNGQMIQLNEGTILLAARSVRWQESYRLPVYKSTDNGNTWTFLSTIDSNGGEPGSLGNPDKGMYEPHFNFLPDGRLAVMYASEKHVAETPSYSQIIAQKISVDDGATWGDEIPVVAEAGEARPGMPVWTQMKDGRYIAVFEVCATQGCNVFYKIFEDGTTWPKGIGTQIPDQLGGPYILSLSDGRLIITSNKSNISVSNDFGKSWQKIESAWSRTLWPSLYQTGPNEVAAVNSVFRESGGNNIQIRFGKINDAN